MADQEIKSSRREWEDTFFIHGEKISIGSATSDAPNVGDFYVPAGTTTAESGLTGRKAIQVNVDPETLPGIYLFRTSYKAFKAY